MKITLEIKNDLAYEYSLQSSGWIYGTYTYFYGTKGRGSYAIHIMEPKINRCITFSNERVGYFDLIFNETSSQYYIRSVGSFAEIKEQSYNKIKIRFK